MPYAQQPPLRLTSAYRPIVYISDTFPTLDEVYDAIVEIYINGAIVTTMYHKPSVVFPLGGGLNTFRFEFDVQKAVQRFTAPMSSVISKTFLPFTGFTAKDTDDNYKQLKVDVQFRKLDVDGFVEEIPGKETSDEVFAVNSIIGLSSDWTMQQFWYNGGNLIDFLTTKPDKSLICFKESESLGYWAEGITLMRVATYNDSGAQIDIDFTTIAVTGDKVVTVSIGPEQINAVPVWDGGIFRIGANTCYYTIEVGTLGGLGGTQFVARSNVRTYYIRKACCSVWDRVHFMGSMGISESYTFDGLSEINSSTNTTLSEKPLSLTQVASDRGQFSSAIDSRRGGELVALPLLDSVFWWMMSVPDAGEMYLQQSGEYLPINIASSDLEKLKDEEEDGLVSLSYTNANRTVTHIN